MPEIDEVELAERTSEIVWAALEAHRHDKDAALRCLAERLARKELEERWQKEYR